MNALTARILARHERPFLHVAETNTTAIALYERLGFETRRRVTFRGYRTPRLASDREPGPVVHAPEPHRRSRGPSPKPTGP